MHVHVRMELKKHGNKVEIKTQKKNNLHVIQKDGGEKRQEEYPTCTVVPLTADGKIFIVV